MLIKIIDGFVEIGGEMYQIGDIIECDDVRAKSLIQKGYCTKLDKYDSDRYFDKNGRKNNGNNYKADKSMPKNKSGEMSLDDFQGQIKL